MSKGKTYYTPEDLSERWSLPLATLSQWRWHRKGPPFVKMGKHIRYYIEGVESFENRVVETNTCYEKHTIEPNFNLVKSFK